MELNDHPGRLLAILFGVGILFGVFFLFQYRAVQKMEVTEYVPPRLPPVEEKNDLKEVLAEEKRGEESLLPPTSVHIDWAEAATFVQPDTQEKLLDQIEGKPRAELTPCGTASISLCRFHIFVVGTFREPEYLRGNTVYRFLTPAIDYDENGKVKTITYQHTSYGYFDKTLKKFVLLDNTPVLSYHPSVFGASLETDLYWLQTMPVALQN